ncbi:phosphatase PAP2 family protein [Altererythrobacter sp. HHU K3-1]|uniref:Phosphatase PAP2 family protein n=2 Tax=Qipengyuania atrilutea TaxID=2744473 RepID=A0A850GXQ4_9SPHN|nr:phosphatase PAP2 family protein [Actirhodobacter atriluteus]
MQSASAVTPQSTVSKAVIPVPFLDELSACIFQELAQNQPMRLGYLLIIGIVAASVLTAVLLGESAALLFGWQGVGDKWLFWFMPLIGWYALVTFQMMRRGIKSPLRGIRYLTAKHWRWLLRGFALSLLLVPAGRSAMRIKESIPSFVDFYADSYFVSADRFIFGTDPWRITHAVLGPQATFIIDRIYLLWFVVLLGLMVWLAFERDKAFQVKAILTFVLSWTLLGNVAAISMASVGPVFYENQYGDPYFRDLMEILRSQPDLKALQIADYLWTSDGLGSGISAMPSLHVAIAHLALLCVLERIRNRVVIWLAVAFEVVIFVGSVHLAWHYAVDGLFSIVAVSLIWIAFGSFVRWLERRAPSHSRNSTKPFFPVPATADQFKVMPSLSKLSRVAFRASQST